MTIKPHLHVPKEVGSGGNTLIGVLLLCHEVSAMQHSYLLDTHNVTFDCGIETLLL